MPVTATPPAGAAGKTPRIPDAPEEILAQEDALVADILDFVEDKDTEQHLVRIPRMSGKGEVRSEIRLTVRPLRSHEIEAARAECTRDKYDPAIKARRRMLDETEFESKVIYLATLPADRVRLWDKVAGTPKYDVPQMMPHLAVDRALHPGERARLFAQVETYSGFAFASDIEVEEALAK